MNTQNSTNVAVKEKKPKGPIRFEAIIPFGIIVGLIVTYFVLFFDTHLRLGIQYVVTKANGAEANVADVTTRFLGGSFALSGLQVTNSEKPELNVLEIGRMNFQFSWDALLRAKLLVQDASIENFQVGTKRSKPGFVVPKENDPQLESAEQDAQGSALADATQLLKGAVPLDNLQNIGELKSSKKIEELKNQLATKQKQWDEMFKTMPTAADFAALQTRVSQVRIGGTNDLVQIQKQVSDVTSLVNETNEKITSVKAKGDAIQSDIQQFNQSMKSMEDVVKEDLKDLESRIQLPKLDVESLSKQFFGEEFVSKIRKAKRYIALAQEYMPPRRTEKQEVLVAHERAKGRNFEFPTTTSYPLFWLRRAALSSKAEGSPFGGDVSGELKDVTSNPSLIGKPAVLDLKGDFPKTEIRGVTMKAVFDHTTDIPMQSLTARVTSFPVAGKTLSESNELKLGFEKARGQTEFEGVVRAGEVSVKSNTTFGDISYITQSNNEQVQQILQGAVAEASRVTVLATAKGAWDDLHMSLESNLASALQKGFEKQLKAKIDEAKKKIQDLIDSKIGKQKEELTQQSSAVQNQFKSQIDQKTKEADNIKKQAENKLAEAKNQAAGQGQKAMDKAVDDVKKKFGF
ncbi:MAG: TIGR03545 family protein [Bdellovibrionales bacterium]